MPHPTAPERHILELKRSFCVSPENSFFPLDPQTVGWEACERGHLESCSEAAPFSPLISVHVITPHTLWLAVGRDSFSQWSLVIQDTDLQEMRLYFLLMENPIPFV